MKWYVFLLIFVFVSFGLMGCPSDDSGPSISKNCKDYCAWYKDCGEEEDEDWDEDECVEDCIEDEEDLQDSDDYVEECKSEYQDQFDCMLDKIDCDEMADLASECEDEIDALAECIEENEGDDDDDDSKQPDRWQNIWRERTYSVFI